MTEFDYRMLINGLFVLRILNPRTWLRSSDLKLSLPPPRLSLPSACLLPGLLMDRLCLLVILTILLEYGRFLSLRGKRVGCGKVNVFLIVFKLNILLCFLLKVTFYLFVHSFDDIMDKCEA